MKNIENYESFLNEAQEASPMEMEAAAEMEMANDFDPEKAKQALADYVKRTGSGSSDQDKTGLNFPNIKQVFGREDYNFRIAIAQALYLAGMNLFPTNKYHFKDIQEWDLVNFGTTMTYYIGEGPQNELLKGVSVAQLNAVKFLAAKVFQDFGKYIGGKFGYSNGKYAYEFTLSTIKAFPEVKAAAAALKGVKLTPTVPKYTPTVPKYPRQ